MFCPHYRRYRGNTPEIVPITTVEGRGFNAIAFSDKSQIYGYARTL